MDLGAPRSLFFASVLFLENVGFTMGILAFLKKSRFIFKDGFESVLEVFQGFAREEKGVISSYLLIDQSSTYVFWSLFLCFFVFLVRYVDVFLWFYWFFCFLCVFLLFIWMFLFFCLFFFSRKCSVSVLSLQTAFPTFKNNGFTMEILTFLKTHSFVLENCFGCSLVLLLAYLCDQFCVGRPVWELKIAFLIFFGVVLGVWWGFGGSQIDKIGFPTSFFYANSVLKKT